MRQIELCVVDGLVPAAGVVMSLRDEMLGIALDQRAFGPRQTLVAFARRDGVMTGIAYTVRRDPIEPSLHACIEYLGDGAALAVVYTDEPIAQGPPPDGLGERWAAMRVVFAARDIELVDWFQCDDQWFRTVRTACEPGGDGWDALLP